MPNRLPIVAVKIGISVVSHPQGCTYGAASAPILDLGSKKDNTFERNLGVAINDNSSNVVDIITTTFT